MKERKAFGKRLDEFQALQFRLADMATELEAARTFLWRAAAALDRKDADATMLCAMAKRFGTDHHELVLEPNVVETIETLTSSLEEPFGDSSMLPTYYVSCMARKYVTVALSGDGGV